MPVNQTNTISKLFNNTVATIITVFTAISLIIATGLYVGALKEKIDQLEIRVVMVEDKANKQAEQLYQINANINIVVTDLKWIAETLKSRTIEK